MIVFCERILKYLIILLQGSVIRYFLSISVVIFAFVFSSCLPEPKDPNPLNYEDFVNTNDRYASFSPNGLQIAYCHYSNKIPEPVGYPSGIYLIDTDGNNRQLVLPGYHQAPSWSPDGQWLVFTTSGVIQKCKTTGENLISFEGLPGEEEDALFFPFWTKDDRYILFDRAVNKIGESNLFSTEKDFSSTQTIYGNIVIAGRDSELEPLGDKLVYMKASIDWRGWEIFVMDTLNTFDLRLTDNDVDDLYPTWSPNGAQISWSSNVRIFIMNADGSNKESISYGKFPSWSIKNEIVFSHANSDYSKEVLYTIDTNGANKKQITF